MGDTKIAAMGIKLRRWVTCHGFSVNIDMDMRYFDQIIACGIADKKVGMVSQFAPHATVTSVTEALLTSFADYFQVGFDTSPVLSTVAENVDDHPHLFTNAS